MNDGRIEPLIAELTANGTANVYEYGQRYKRGAKQRVAEDTWAVCVESSTEAYATLPEAVENAKKLVAERDEQ